MTKKKYGTMKCQKCGRTIRYKISPKYVKGDPNRLIAIRRHYSRYHPKAMAKWHKGIKHRDAKHPRKRGNPKRNVKMSKAFRSWIQTPEGREEMGKAVLRMKGVPV